MKKMLVGGSPTVTTKGMWRKDLEATMGVAMFRYMSKVLDIIMPSRMNIKCPQIYKDGNLLIITMGSLTRITCPKVHIIGNVVIDGDVQINGNLTVSGDVVAGGISLRNHVHPGCSGGQTGKPR